MSVEEIVGVGRRLWKCGEDCGVVEESVECGGHCWSVEDYGSVEMCGKREKIVGWARGRSGW